MYDENTRTVTAFYETRAAATAQQARLVAMGVPASDITIVAGADQSEPGRVYEERGFFEAIADFFMGEDDRSLYNEGLRRGGYLLTARVADAHYGRVLALLDTDDAVDLDARSESWRSEGWQSEGWDNGGTSAAAATGMTGIDRPTAQGYAPGEAGLGTNDETIQVMKEDVRIGKRDVSHGRVRVRSYVVEDQVSEDVDLRSERVEIERRPVDRRVEPGADMFRDTTIEAQETAEEVVVSKEARIVEEIALRKRADTTTETVTEKARRTEVEIEDDRGVASIKPETSLR